MRIIRVENVAEFLATAIRNNNPEASSFAVLKYGLVTLINFIITISTVLIISLITGHFSSGVLAAAGFPFLRYFSNGIHLKSSHVCNIVTSSFMLIAIYTPLDYWYNGFVLNIIAVVLIAIYAPSGIKRSKIDPKYYPVVKMVAVSIVSLNFVFQLPVLAIAFFIQSLTTTSIAQKLVDKYNL